jgi:hypothetical protein
MMSHDDDRLRQALRAHAAKMAAARPLPSASAIWLRAERRRRRAAIERAERPLRVMQTIGLVIAACAAGWLLSRSDAFHPLPAIGNTSLILLLACGVLACAGCWTMWIAERRPTSR